MTTFTDKELIKEIKERIGSLDVRDDIERRAYEKPKPDHKLNSCRATLL